MRACSECGEYKIFSDFGFHQKMGHHLSACKPCNAKRNEYSRIYRNKHKIKVSAYENKMKMIRYHNNPAFRASVLSSSKKWRTNNTNKVRQYKRGITRIIGDSYVIAVLNKGLKFRLKKSDIPNSILETKREHIKLIRKIKEYEN